MIVRPPRSKRPDTFVPSTDALPICIGASHSVVFGGFSANSIADRVRDCQSKLIITADEGLRGGKSVPLKANVDAALKMPGTNTVETVLVVRHTGGAVEIGRASWRARVCKSV